MEGKDLKALRKTIKEGKKQSIQIKAEISFLIEHLERYHKLNMLLTKDEISKMVKTLINLQENVNNKLQD